LKISGKKYEESLSFKTVFIGPFDMNLLYFAPALRRDYMDNILERAFSQFRIVKRDYEGIMRQRNALLKKIRE
jgi:recombinational DNA repair ATPase RecF